MADAVSAGDWRLREFVIIAYNAIGGCYRRFARSDMVSYVSWPDNASERPRGGKALILARCLNSIIADAIEMRA